MMEERKNLQMRATKEYKLAIYYNIYAKSVLEQNVMHHSMTCM